VAVVKSVRLTTGREEAGGELDEVLGPSRLSSLPRLSGGKARARGERWVEELSVPFNDRIIGR
jgi:hypothetical protein